MTTFLLLNDVSVTFLAERQIFSLLSSPAQMNVAADMSPDPANWIWHILKFTWWRVLVCLALSFRTAFTQTQGRHWECLRKFGIETVPRESCLTRVLGKYKSRFHNKQSVGTIGNASPKGQLVVFFSFFFFFLSLPPQKGRTEWSDLAASGWWWVGWSLDRGWTALTVSNTHTNTHSKGIEITTFCQALKCLPCCFYFLRS